MLFTSAVGLIGMTYQICFWACLPDRPKMPEPEGDIIYPPAGEYPKDFPEEMIVRDYSQVQIVEFSKEQMWQYQHEKSLPGLLATLIPNR